MSINSWDVLVAYPEMKIWDKLLVVSVPVAVVATEYVTVVGLG